MAVIRAAAVQKMPGGEQAVNVFHFITPDNTNASVDVAHNKILAFYNAIKTILSNGWFLERVVYSALNSAPPAPVSFALIDERVTPGVQGSLTGAPLPNDVAVVITWKTGKLGRRGRGRTYIAGWTPQSLGGTGGGDAAVLPAAHVSQLSTAAGTFKADDPAAMLAVFSKLDHQAYNVLDGYVNDSWDTQRRRGKSVPTARTAF